MSEISLEVNGRQISTEDGKTILEACEQAGIDIPTLCHYTNLTDVGACRLCTVEIDGERFETACTTPAQDGISVKTETDELKEHRRRILELICAEENHYCMYCEQDGDCELQDLLMEYGVDHVSFPFSYKSFSVDAVSEHMVVDNNRCILCGRCIRTCEEVVANDTLDYGGRGQDTKVVADLDQPMGESTCISCGACLQVCPTGTIFSKHSIYRGNTKECSSEESYCSECGISCGIEVFTRSGRIVQIQGTEVNQPSGGQLCEKGRFGPLKEDRERVTDPYLNENGEAEEIELREALELAGEKLSDSEDVAGMVSGLLPTETLEKFRKLMEDFGGSFRVKGSEKVSAEKELLEASSSLNGDLHVDSVEDLLGADEVSVFDSTIVDTHPVISAYIRRGAKGKSGLFVTDESEDRFSRYSDESSVGEIDTSAPERRLEENEETYVIIGQNISDKGKLSEIYDLAEGTNSKVISVHPFSNYRVEELDMDEIEGTEGIYLLPSDDKDLEEMISAAQDADYVIVQASRKSRLTEEADLVLPGLVWSERSGTLKDINGENKSINSVLEPQTGIDTERELLDRIGGLKETG